MLFAGDQIRVEQDAVKSLNDVCQEMNKRCESAKKVLLEDIHDVETGKHTLQCLDQALEFIATHLSKKRNSIASSISSVNQDNPITNEGWAFVDQSFHDKGA
ncbi:hypothetical protein DM01DRAFT_1340495 [Hesseltinella vesiculosa]|uniref:Uncharacterized protein n=1 Tax=Hesseltinella vesiculosa TaxID=101127 RepID=A0A1X2G3U0_9FUNG|nr:hypothetical protein DM01DRAFT_1340495 [Hesseltinella vesiculosa]